MTKDDLIKGVLYLKLNEEVIKRQHYYSETEKERTIDNWKKWYGKGFKRCAVEDVLRSDSNFSNDKMAFIKNKYAANSAKVRKSHGGTFRRGSQDFGTAL